MRMQKNIEAANKNKPKPITHLGDIINNKSINMVLQQASADEKKQLAEHLPESQQEAKYLAQNMRSPQFLQAIDALTDAMNSENSIGLFMELGLDQKFMQKYYGVDAFIRALEDWGSKQPKEESPSQKMDIEKAPEKQE